MKTQSLMFAFSATLLAACGGSGDNNNAATDNGKPSDFPPRRAMYAAPALPDASEQQKIEDGKTYSRHYVFLQGLAQTQDFDVDGHRVFSHVHTGNGAVARVDARSLPQGFADRSMTSNINGRQVRQNVRSYQGFRSGIMVLHNETEGSAFSAPFGYETPVAQLPNAGHATYSGTAFDRHERGQVNYHVDFAARSGHGSITGLNRFGTITLHEAAYAQHPDTLNHKTDYRNIGDATASNGSKWRYTTKLYGDKAEELVGEMNNSQYFIGFHATRGEIVE